MKKNMALLLAMTLCLAAVGPAIAEDECFSIHCDLFDAIDATVDEYFVTEENRNFFAAAAILSIATTDGIPPEYITIIVESCSFENNAVYLAPISSRVGMVMFFGGHDALLFMYKHSEGADEANVQFAADFSSADAEDTMQYYVEMGIISSYYQADVMDVYEILTNATE